MRHPIVSTLSACALLLVAVFFILESPACSTSSPQRQAQPPAFPPPAAPSAPPTPTPGPPPVTCPDGSAPGTLKDLGCSAGQSGEHKEVCNAAGAWIDAINSCTGTPPTCAKSLFADVLPTLQQSCVSCHAAIVTYATANAWSAEISRRVALPLNNNDHMPEKAAAQLCAPINAANDPAQPTSCERTALLQKWVADGALNVCPGQPTPPPPKLITQDYLNTLAIADASSLNAADRQFTVYLTTASVLDDATAKFGIKTCIDAMNKGLNSLNPLTSDLVPVKALDTAQSLFRVDIRNYGMNRGLLQLLQDQDKLINIVDNSSKGIILQGLMNQKKPVMDADVFLDTAFRNAWVYYDMLRVPNTLPQYQVQIGVNVAADLANLPTNPRTGAPQVAFIGGLGQITEQKNRNILRDVQASSGSAYYYQTNDVNATPHLVVINGKHIDSKNLSQAPLLVGTGANVANASLFNFTPDASETIAQLPNGLQAYALWDAKGNRLDAADPGIVIDTQTPIGNKQITAGNTCSRCHNFGLIPMGDTILAHVTANADQFTANDVLLAKAVYHGDTVNTAQFKVDSSAFTTALTRLGIDPGADPQAVLSDRLLDNWTVELAAARLKISVDCFKTALNESPTSKAAIGELLSGGTVPFATFASTLAQLIADAHLFQDPVSAPADPTCPIS